MGTVWWAETSFSRGRAVVAAALAVIVSIAALAAIDRSSTPPWRASRSHAGLEALPGSARAVVSAALGRSDPAYRVLGLRAANPGQRFAARFTSSGVSVRADSARLSLGLAAVGRGASLRPLPSATPRASGNRVSYARGFVSEWYLNGPLGLEQGFNLARRPAGTGDLTLAIRVAGSLRARMVAGAVVFGSSGLSYGGLRVTDARGRAVPAWLSIGRGQLLIHVLDTRTVYPLRIDPLVQQQKLTASGTHIDFGEHVALSADGSTALIGSPVDNDAAGTAWFFTRSGSTWTLAQTVPAPTSDSPNFGFSVALSSDGSTALIGGPVEDGFDGAAWVYTRSGSTWTVQQELTPSSGTASSASFGATAALSADGNTALIGGPEDNSGTGAAYVFTRSDSTWTQQQKLTAPSGTEATDGLFGNSVALSADASTALIGGNSPSAPVWVFARSGSTFTEQQTIPAPAAAAASFGATGVAVSSDGSTALIGATDVAGGGAAWTYKRSGTTFTEQQELTAPAGTETAAGGFGYSVALTADGNEALIGGPRDGAVSTNSGAAWVFTRSGSTWTEQQTLTPVGGTETSGGEFGWSVALSDDASTALIGGPNDNSAGAAWVFTGPPESSGGGGGSGGGGATTTQTASFGDQSITLTTPSACVAAGGKLPVTLNSKTVAHKKPKLKFKLAQFYIDKGRKHTKRVKKTHKVHGKTVVVKKHGKPVFVKKTVYLPNATARHVQVTESLSVAGLSPGTHTLRVKISYKKTIRKHGRKHTRIVTKTLKVTFTIC